MNFTEKVSVVKTTAETKGNTGSFTIVDFERFEPVQWPNFESRSVYFSSKGWSFSVTKDLGSGMNYNKRGLKQLLEQIMNGQIGRLVLTHKDRLLRFGAELVFSLCAVKNVEVVIINQGDEPTFEEELAKDVLEIITVFSARLYGSRSHKNKQLIANLQSAVASA